MNLSAMPSGSWMHPKLVIVVECLLLKGTVFFKIYLLCRFIFLLYFSAILCFGILITLTKKLELIMFIDYLMCLSWSE